MREKLKQAVYSPSFAVVAAFLLRVAIFYPMEHALQAHAVRDIPRGAELGNVAAAIARGQGFSSPLRWSNTGPTAWFTPAYPYLLAGIFKLFGVYSYASDLVSHTLDIAFASFTCWPIYAIGKKAFDRKAGLLSAWVWALLPAAVTIPILWTWDTALASLWMALLVLATLHLRDSSRPASWLGYGALWAAGAMINPSLLAVLPFLAGWALWPVRHELLRALRLASVAGMIFVAGVSPWMVRNYVVFHKIIPFRSNFGLELWLGNNPAVPDTWSPFLHPNDNAEEGKVYTRMTEIPYMAEKQREAFDFAREHPSDALRFTFHRFEETWLGVSDPPADVWSAAPLKEIALLLQGCLFSLLALFGVLVAYRRKREAATPFAFVLLVFPLVFYVTHTSGRYRLPMDTIMTVLAGYALIQLFAWLGERAGVPLRSSPSATLTPS